MSMKRYTGSAFSALSTFKRWTGSAWQTLTTAKRYDGSQWVDLFEGGGGGGETVKTYSLAQSQIYWNGGSKDNQKDTSGVLIHGTWNGALSSARRSLLWFDSAISTDLQGATIEKVELYLYRENSSHGVSGAANVYLKTHNFSTVPSSWTGADTGAADSGTPTLKRGAGAWFTLLNSVGEGLRDGTVKGIALDADSSTSISAYIRYLRTGSNAPKLRITYTR